jgi:hypothetical protein
MTASTTKFKRMFGDMSCKPSPKATLCLGNLRNQILAFIEPKDVDSEFRHLQRPNF